MAFHTLQAATGVRDLDDLVERFTSHKENRRMIEAEKRAKDKKLRERKAEVKHLKHALEQAILDSRDAEAAATASSAIIKEKYDKLEDTIRGLNQSLESKKRTATRLSSIGVRSRAGVRALLRKLLPFQGDLLATASSKALSPQAGKPAAGPSIASLLAAADGRGEGSPAAPGSPKKKKIAIDLDSKECRKYATALSVAAGSSMTRTAAEALYSAQKKDEKWGVCGEDNVDLLLAAGMLSQLMMAGISGIAGGGSGSGKPPASSNKDPKPGDPLAAAVAAAAASHDKRKSLGKKKKSAKSLFKSIAAKAREDSDGSFDIWDHVKDRAQVVMKEQELEMMQGEELACARGESGNNIRIAPSRAARAAELAAQQYHKEVARDSEHRENVRGRADVKQRAATRARIDFRLRKYSVFLSADQDQARKNLAGGSFMGRKLTHAAKQDQAARIIQGRVRTRSRQKRKAIKQAKRDGTFLTQQEEEPDPASTFQSKSIGGRKSALMRNRGGGSRGGGSRGRSRGSKGSSGSRGGKRRGGREMTQEDAATRIQAIHRGKQGRKRAKKKKKRAVKLSRAEKLRYSSISKR